MEYICYIIYSDQHDKYYVGFTSEAIQVRLQKHNANHKGFTGKHSDWRLMYHEIYSTKALAMQREKEIKAWKSRIKLEKLIGLSDK